ncbi:hypothetical protein GW15_0212765 [Xanthomonas axonopodis pv. vasculorum]|uniref:Uncharacterized protein n=1 Tax=Xanthomonas axonopodis pv. vasculorum TaxID=325777 RepID=A0A098PXE1_9XANT|nr:hypothetical protein GW15_0212765 [Xanthomonas axonopodis pv. vasculorum]
MRDGESTAIFADVTTRGTIGGERTDANSITRDIDVAIRNKGHGDVLLHWKTAAA